MNITEAVNAILKRYLDYGYDIFLDLNEIKEGRISPKGALIIFQSLT